MRASLSTAWQIRRAWMGVAMRLRLGCRWFFGQDWIAMTAVAIALPILFMLPLLVKWLGRDLERAPVRAATAQRSPMTALDGQLVFSDVTSQSVEFIGYYHSIQLTAEQEAIKATVLETMPAACCNGSTAYTCCCPCNLSKTLWGLSNYLIARRGANAAELTVAVYAWMNFTNPQGYTGVACYKGGCEGAFHTNGCGGMREDELLL